MNKAVPEYKGSICLYFLHPQEIHKIYKFLQKFAKEFTVEYPLDNIEIINEVSLAIICSLVRNITHKCLYAHNTNIGVANVLCSLYLSLHSFLIVVQNALLDRIDILTFEKRKLGTVRTQIVNNLWNCVLTKTFVSFYFYSKSKHMEHPSLFSCSANNFSSSPSKMPSFQLLNVFRTNWPSIKHFAKLWKFR